MSRAPTKRYAEEVRELEMDTNPESPVVDVARLRRYLNDLASIMILPSRWEGVEPRTICSTLADVLLGTLDLAFVFVRLAETDGKPAIEVIRTVETIRPDLRVLDLKRVLDIAGEEASPKRSSGTRVQVWGGEFNVSTFALGCDGEIGVVLAGSERLDFPMQTEGLLLNVAASQAALRLQQSRLLNEQKHVSRDRDLDERVAQRTRELEAANEQLQRQDRESRLIVNNIPGMVALLSSRGDVETVNPQLSEYFGQTLEQLRLWGTNDTIHPEDLPHVIETFSRAISTGTPYQILQRFKRADGVYRWFQNRSSPVRGTDGDINRWCVLLTDIDDEKRAEEALRERELNLRQITETIPEMLWSSAPDGSIDYCNGRLQEFTGFTLAELQGTGWTKVLHPDDVEVALKAWRHSVETGDPYRVEVRNIHASDHTYRWCAVRALPLVDSGGRIVKWHGTVVDLHDWKLAQEELRSTQAELAKMMRVMTMGELTASIAHEVNQPLSGIITNANICLRMLSLDPPNIDEARETAIRTIRDGNRASDVITRLRSLFSRKPIASEPIDLNEAAREVLALQMDEFQRRRIIVRHEFEGNLQMVRGDRVQVQQVILNLVRNASDAMRDLTDRPRVMMVRTERGDEEDVRFYVADTGPGFDPGAADRLFEPFYTTKADGMGIGLSVSRSIVEAHQGRMWAVPNDGPGATFVFSIPAARESGIAVARPAMKP